MLTEIDLERLIKKDKVIVLCLLAILVLTAWAYMVHMAQLYTDEMVMDNACASKMQWEFGDIILSFIMWSIMVVAMMLPAATPMVLMFTTLNRQQNQRNTSLVATESFVLGYLIIWIAYSVLATVVQWILQMVALLSHTLVINSPLIGGSLLIMAGIFQLTPFRDACMKKCRSPMGFILSEWREGKVGALIMGIKHGLFCVGCCWMLMALSLVLGVMNLLWMAALTVFMVLEKGEVGGKLLTLTMGLVLVVWGLAVILIDGILI